ncbi:2-oxo acid dehydrogenase subunit E2 [Escherichia coli]
MLLTSTKPISPSWKRSVNSRTKEAAKRKLDVKITPVVFIMKAVAAALEQMPRFNSSLSERR